MKYYSIRQLIDKKMIGSRVRITNLISSGKLKAVDFSTGKNKQYRVSEKSLQEFLDSPLSIGCNTRCNE